MAEAGASGRDGGSTSASGGGAGGQSVVGSAGADSKELYTFEAPWPVYGLAWSLRPDKKFRIALGSFIEE